MHRLLITTLNINVPANNLTETLLVRMAN